MASISLSDRERAVVGKVVGDGFVGFVVAAFGAFFVSKIVRKLVGASVAGVDSEASVGGVVGAVVGVRIGVGSANSIDVLRSGENDIG